MNLMSKRKTFLTGLTVAVALILLAADAFPQEQQKIFFKSSAANSKYLQQHVIDARDVPGHQIRIIELRRVYPTDPPAYDGVRLVEELSGAIPTGPRIPAARSIPAGQRNSVGSAAWNGSRLA